MDATTSKYDWLWSIKASDYKIFYKHKPNSNRWLGSNIEDKEGLKKACTDLNSKTNKGINDLLSLDYWCYENENHLD